MRAAARPSRDLASRLAGNGVDLIATMIAEACAEADNDAQTDESEPWTAVTPAHTALMDRVLGYVDLHLSDPGLTPRSIAQAHSVSLRYLYLLFASVDAMPSGWIRRRRLEECRRELAAQGAADVTVAAIALHWGFASPAHFSRIFRTAYGLSPREWRAGRELDRAPAASTGRKDGIPVPREPSGAGRGDRRLSWAASIEPAGNCTIDVPPSADAYGPHSTVAPAACAVAPPEDVLALVDFGRGRSLT